MSYKPAIRQLVSAEFGSEKPQFTRIWRHPRHLRHPRFIVRARRRLFCDLNRKLVPLSRLDFEFQARRFKIAVLRIEWRDVRRFGVDHRRWIDLHLVLAWRNAIARLIGA